jgi:hypothetical protein
METTELAGNSSMVIRLAFPILLLLMGCGSKGNPQTRPDDRARNHKQNGTDTIGQNETQEKKGIPEDRSETEDIDGLFAKFRESMASREDTVKKLLPHINIGMTSTKVEELLGPPSRKKNGGAFWAYTIFYSLSLDIYFDQDMKVKRIDAATGLISEIQRSARTAKFDEKFFRVAVFILERAMRIFDKSGKYEVYFVDVNPFYEAYPNLINVLSNRKAKVKPHTNAILGDSITDRSTNKRGVLFRIFLLDKLPIYTLVGYSVSEGKGKSHSTISIVHRDRKKDEYRIRNKYIHKGDEKIIKDNSENEMDLVLRLLRSDMYSFEKDSEYGTYYLKVDTQYVSPKSVIASIHPKNAQVKSYKDDTKGDLHYPAMSNSILFIMKIYKWLDEQTAVITHGYYLGPLAARRHFRVVWKDEKGTWHSHYLTGWIS